MKVLEYVNENKVIPIGGPCGYVYNLSNRFPEKEEHIFFISQSEKSSGIQGLKKYFPRIIVDIARAIKETKFVHAILKGDEVIPNMNDYDIIHFHSAFDFERCKNALLNYRGKVLLTIHTPIPPFQEPYQDYNSSITRFFGGKYRMRKYTKVCNDALDDCDYLVFPCPEAEESYHILWDGYSAKRKKIEEKVVYLPTGCVPKKPKIGKSEIRSSLSYKESDFIICYVGRHSSSKGYDSLINLASQMTNDDIKFLICGKEGPLFPPYLPNWHEVGWTKDADSYINASDVFVLPNKNTYFDLVFLEVLSIGKIIVASNTGGNKYFKRYDNAGIFLYDSCEDAKKILLEIKSMSDNEREELGERNKDIFKSHFSPDIFSRHYYELYSDICNGRRTRKEYID